MSRIPNELGEECKLLRVLFLMMDETEAATRKRTTQKHKVSVLKASDKLDTLPCWPHSYFFLRCLNLLQALEHSPEGHKAICRADFSSTFFETKHLPISQIWFQYFAVKTKWRYPLANRLRDWMEHTLILDNLEYARINFHDGSKIEDNELSYFAFPSTTENPEILKIKFELLFIELHQLKRLGIYMRYLHLHSSRLLPNARPTIQNVSGENLTDVMNTKQIWCHAYFFILIRNIVLHRISLSNENERQKYLYPLQEYITTWGKEAYSTLSVNQGPNQRDDTTFCRFTLGQLDLIPNVLLLQITFHDNSIYTNLMNDTINITFPLRQL